MKMQTLPIVPWIGGKRRLAKHILPLFPAHECYVEPFCGAAALYFLKTPGKIEVINDINGELVNLYRVVKHHLEEFVRQFKWALVSRQIYKWLQITPEETLTDIQRATFRSRRLAARWQSTASVPPPHPRHASTCYVLKKNCQRHTCGFPEQS